MCLKRLLLMGLQFACNCSAPCPSHRGMAGCAWPTFLRALAQCRVFAKAKETLHRVISVGERFPAWDIKRRNSPGCVLASRLWEYLHVALRYVSPLYATFADAVGDSGLSYDACQTWSSMCNQGRTDFLLEKSPGAFTSVNQTHSPDFLGDANIQLPLCINKSDAFSWGSYAMRAFPRSHRGEGQLLTAKQQVPACTVQKKVTESSVTLACGLVPRAGLEPAQLLPLPPQDSVSTSSTTHLQKVIRPKSSAGQVLGARCLASCVAN